MKEEEVNKLCEVTVRVRARQKYKKCLKKKIMVFFNLHIDIKTTARNGYVMNKL